nr:FAD/NAD(P)-binding oxidoreductase [Trinickia terrae]
MIETTMPANGRPHHKPTFDIVVVGGGAAGIGVTASLLRRQPRLRIAIVEPSDKHYYQPGWTLVGGGAFEIGKTVRPTASLIPGDAQWIQARVTRFAPERDAVELDDGRELGYRHLIVCPGLQLGWDKIDGLEASLGKHGVTSNYRFDLAPYTWQLVRETRRGRALFTQPPMPIKCAGAPQKALYLACDHWRREGVLANIDVEFNNAGAALFGVAAFVPSLMRYIERYHAALAFNSNLVAVDGPNRVATFAVKDADGNVTRVDKPFDMLHVVPPQAAPDFIRTSPLANPDGWCETDPATLRHPRYPNIFALGDVCSTSNAKTAAAVRKQIVIVARNLLAARDGQPLPAAYDGYGACPLTVEKGKVVFAEFGYGGKLLPTFPLDGTVARRSSWHMKTKLLPWLYWEGMLKGHEWLTQTKAG